MNIIEKFQHLIDNVDDRTFYLSLTGLLTFIILCVAGIIFYYYSAVGSLYEQIDHINEQRVQAKRILTMYKQVEKHRLEVDTLLTEDTGFKISGYFNAILGQLGLADKKGGLSTTSHIDHGKYSEAILKAPLTDINMRQLCELLEKLESNKRIYVKELEIAKSKKKNKVLDVTLTIASLEPTIASGA